MTRRETHIEIDTLTDKMMAMACTICSIDFDESAPYPTMTISDMSRALACINARIGELCYECIANTCARSCITRAMRVLHKSVNARESRSETIARVKGVLDGANMGALLLAFIARKELALTSLILG